MHHLMRLQGRFGCGQTLTTRAEPPGAVIEEDSAPYGMFGDCVQTDFEVSFKVNLRQQSNQFDAVRTAKALAYCCSC